ncbi:MAG TPA: hypothetical protein IAB56_02960 [Candidatus Scybalousia intestinigallinarum]|nr:hypothetical protein [Candidatus Scybalousia intestinigallinarum]
MDIEEIDTVLLKDTREALVKKLGEINELLASIQLKLSQIDVVDNEVWSSPASQTVYDYFDKDYQHYQELSERFFAFVQFLESVENQYDKLDASIKKELSNIESVSL